MSDIIIDPKDKKFFVHNPGKDFNPSRNKAIINETIRETEAYFTKLNTLLDDDMLNRLDIMNSYGRYRLGGIGQKRFEDWAGRDLTRQLIGEKILQKVRIAQTSNKLRPKSILL